MADATTLFFAGATLLVSIMAALIVFSIYGVYRGIMKGWLPIVAAVAFMIMVRAVSFLAEIDWLSPSYPYYRLAVQVLSFCISIFFLYGFWQMKHAMDENDRVERETMARMHEFEIKHKKHEDLRLQSSRRDRGRSLLEMRVKKASKTKQEKK